MTGELVGKSAKIERANGVVDAMPPNLRSCVHEFGYAIVWACLQANVKEPNQIRQLVHEIWEGARQPVQRASKGGGTSSAVMQQLDWLLLQAGSEINAARLVRFMHSHGWTLVPFTPSLAMITASMAEVSDFQVVCSKGEKHKRRLAAAIKAGSKALFPHLYTTKQLLEGSAQK